ncbi:MAG: PaaI family thioesterase [Anaerolineae bacterium]|nr:PaaI family thioesterase [Anaerolineae bacterium]MDW8071318.1 PaaI family thioesterase [Anaerolineae bacterium]
MTSDEWLAFLRQDFARGFPAYCGILVTHVAPGVFETYLEVRPEHQQQDGFVHAGVMATMADHTGGYAAFTLVPPHQRVLTIEFKINFFRPATGHCLICRARVVHGGRRILVSEADVFARADGAEKHVARALVTLMAVESDHSRRSA